MARPPWATGLAMLLPCEEQNHASLHRFHTLDATDTPPFVILILRNLSLASLEVGVAQLLELRVMA